MKWKCQHNPHLSCYSSSFFHDWWLLTILMFFPFLILWSPSGLFSLASGSVFRVDGHGTRTCSITGEQTASPFFGPARLHSQLRLFVAFVFPRDFGLRESAHIKQQLILSWTNAILSFIANQSINQSMQPTDH